MKNNFSKIESHRDIISLWGNPDGYGRTVGVAIHAARKHWARNSIPADYWNEIVAQAAKISHPEVTHELLWRLKPERKNARRRPLADAAVGIGGPS